MGMIKTTGILVAVLGVIAFVIGGVFLIQGMQKNNLIVNRMNVEQVTLNVDPANPDVFIPIDNAADAQRAADIIAEHRRGIAPTYQDLLAGGRFDSTNITHLTYAQAMNLENYLYLAVAAFGLIQVAMASGGFMVITGAALFLTGLALYRASLQQELPLNTNL